MNNDKNSIINAISGKLGVDRQTISDAINNKSTEGLLSALDPKDAQKLNRLLNDQEATQRILQSEKVQELIRKLSEGK